MGVAYSKQYPGERALTASEFSGGEKTVLSLLEKLGFTVANPEGLQGSFEQSRLSTSAKEWHLVPGEIIKRTELHAQYGGSGQDGVSPSRQSANVFLFTDPRSGSRHGYEDEWDTDGSFLYTGRGQRGDQQFVSGNKAIRDHAEDGRALRLFEGAGGFVTYVGEFVLDDVQPYQYAMAAQTDSDKLRKVIIFRLRPVSSPPTSLPKKDLGAPYRHQDELVLPKLSEPRSPDPDSYGRGLSAHRRLQNLLAAHVKDSGLTPLSPSVHDPDFDLAWHAGSKMVVVEVKSLTAANQVRQLRMGLGQVLDYTDTLTTRGEDVSPVLYVEGKPREHRWIDLAAKYDVTLAWPESANHLLYRMGG